MSNEIQRDEIYLPGSLGIVRSGDNICDIIEAFSSKDGSVTLTFRPQTVREVAETKDADFEIIQPKQIADATTNGAASKDVL